MHKIKRCEANRQIRFVSHRRARKPDSRPLDHHSAPGVAHHDVRSIEENTQVALDQIVPE